MKQFGPGVSEILNITDDNYSTNFEFYTGVTFGQAAGYSYIEKFGNNPSIPTASVEADIWDSGGLYTFPTTAGTLTTNSSSSADDTAAGEGAKTVKVFGLDSTYTAISETKAMGGTALVSLANNYLRVYRAYVVTAGTVTTNAGTINITQTAVNVARIKPLTGQTLMAIYTVPAGYTGYMLSYYASGRRGVTTGAIDVSMKVKNFGEAWRVRQVVSTQNVGSSYIEHTYKFPPMIPAKSDIRMSVLTSVNSMAIDGGFEMLLKAD